MRFILTGGEAHDSTTAADVLAGRSPAAAIADKACDNNALRDLIGKDGAAAVISSLGSRKVVIPHDTVAYKLRNRVEYFFNKLTHFRTSPPATTDAPSTSLPHFTSPAL